MRIPDDMRARKALTSPSDQRSARSGAMTEAMETAKMA